MNSENNNLTTEFNEIKAEKEFQKKEIADKIEEYYKKNPEKEKTGGPENLKQSIDVKTANLYKYTKEYTEHESLKKHENAVKKSNAVSLSKAQQIGIVAMTGISIAFTSALGYYSGVKLGEHIEREEAYDKAVSYMDGVMPSILSDAGFSVEKYDDNTEFVLGDYTSENIANAKNLLVEQYGFNYDTAELAVATYFDFDDTLYIVRGSDNADKYYEANGYKSGDKYDQMLAFTSSRETFENHTQEQYTQTVNNLMYDNSIEGDSSARN